MSKVCLVVKLVAHEGRGDEIVRAFEPMFAQVEQEPGTEAYALNRASSDPDTLFLYELYADGSALESHLQSDVMKAVFAVVSECVKERERFEGIPVRTYGFGD